MLFSLKRDVSDLYGSRTYQFVFYKWGLVETSET